MKRLNLSTRPSIILALLVGLVAGSVAGWLANDFTHRYDAEWEKMKASAENKLRAAPGYASQKVALEAMLEKRHTELRTSMHSRPIESAYIPTIFLFMYQDAADQNNPQAAAVINSILSDLFGHPAGLRAN